MSEDYLVDLVTNLMAQQRHVLDHQFNENEWAKHQRLNLDRNDLPPTIDNEFEMKTEIRHVLDDLKHADMYFVGKEFNEMLTDYYDQTFDGSDEPLRIDPISRLPSPLCFIVLDQLQPNNRITSDKTSVYATEPSANDTQWTELLPDGVDQRRVGFLCRESEDGAIDIRFVCEYAFPYLCGGYKIGGGLMFPSAFSQSEKDDYTPTIIGISGAFSLINNPRFVIQSPAGTRQQRKAARKGHGVPVEAWHKISWDIDEPVEPRDGDSRTFNMPLHYTRGHWRRNAEEHWKDVEFINGQWMQWRKGYWSGHPAFGIKKGYHAPTTKRAA